MSFLKRSLIILSDENTFMTCGIEIHKLIREKKWHETDAYLKKKKSPDSQDECGWTPLHHCILHNMDDFVLLLLQSNADVNIVTRYVVPHSSLSKKSELSDHVYCTTISPLFLATLLNRRRIARLLAGENVIESNIRMCMELSLSEEIETEILEGICRRLERKFFDISLRAYPGYMQKMPLRRILLGVSSEVFQTKKLTFLSVDVLIRNPEFCDDSDNALKDKERYITSNEGLLLKKVISTYSSRLWQCHSTLNIITGTALIDEKKAGEKGQSRLCVVLYSSITNFIPLRERMLPTKLMLENNDFEVIVREGNAALGPLNSETNCSVPFIKTLRMGSSIGHLGGSSGTMGPVVSIDKNCLGFITCAHVFFQNEMKTFSKVNFDVASPLPKPINVVQPTDDEIAKAKENYDFEVSTSETAEYIYQRTIPEM